MWRRYTPYTKSVLVANDSHNPLLTFGKCDRKSDSDAGSIRQDTYKLNNTGTP